MEYPTIIAARNVWESAVDEHLMSKVPDIAKYEPEQLLLLRKALLVVMTPDATMKPLYASRLLADFRPLEREMEANPAMKEWLDEAKRHHRHAVERIRDRMHEKTTTPAKLMVLVEPYPMPTPREALPTIQEIQPSALAPKEVTMSEMEDEADALAELGIAALQADDSSPVVIDVDDER